MRKNFTVFAIVPVLLLILSLGACSRSERARNEPAAAPSPEAAPIPPVAAERKPSGPAMVRMVNAMPNGPAVDAVAGDHKAFNRVAYKQVTPYKEVTEAKNIRLESAGREAAEPLATSTRDLDAGKHYTLVAVPSRDEKGGDLRVLEDDFTPPEDGKAKVRVINAARDAGDIDVFLKNRENSLFSGLGFTTWGSGYKDVEPAQGPLMIKSETDKQARTVANVNLEPGKAYTIILTGMKGKVDAIRIEDSPMSMQAHEGAEGGAARGTERRRSAY